MTWPPRRCGKTTGCANVCLAQRLARHDWAGRSSARFGFPKQVRGRGVMAAQEPSKLLVRVRSPSPACSDTPRFPPVEPCSELRLETEWKHRVGACTAVGPSRAKPSALARLRP